MVQERILNEYGDGVSWYRGSLLGKGGFGWVYKAKLKNPKSKYSCYPPLMAVKSAEVSASGSIQKEKEVFNNVKGCPHVIQCLGEEITTGVNGTMVYNLLLEYGSGGTLADRIEISGGKGLDEFEVKMFARSILRGLSHIHNLGYVHCDLKPDNILLVKHRGVSQFRAKIGDLGLAKRAKQSKKRKLEPYWRGSPLYISPEAVNYGEQEAPCDIWAFGCTVLEMLTGKPPWNEKKDMNCEDILKAIGEKNALPKIPDNVSKEAKDFLKGCFVRTHKFRWTADMLLCHTFLSNLPEEDGGEEVEEEKDVNAIESIVSVCDTERELSSSSDIYNDDDSISYWSEEGEDAIEETIGSGFGDVVESEIGMSGEVLGSSIETGLITSNDVLSPRSSLEDKHKFPVNLALTTGIC